MKSEIGAYHYVYHKYDKLDVKYRHCCKKQCFCHHASQLRKKKTEPLIYKLCIIYDRIQKKNILNLKS